MVLGRRLLSLTFLSQQSFGYCPRAKRSRGNTRAGLVGYLFETVHNAIAPLWQPGAYIRSCELRSASSSVRTVTSRARRRGGLNTKSVMPWELARRNRSSGGTRSHPNVGHETLSVPGHQLALVGRSVSAGTECVAATCRISKEKAPPKRG